MSFAGAAGAELCTIDAVPAATLLLPYFEIDLGRSARRAEDTIISINNADPAPTIAHVIVWSDLSVPTLAFDIFLTGFDVQRFSLGELFRNGLLPDGRELSEAGDTVGGLTDLQELRDAHVGREVDGLCYGTPSGRVVRGYVTIDNVSQDSILFPNDEGYFTDVANDVNQLWGQWFVVKKSYIQAENLVSIEAASNSSRFGNNDYTFYGRYTGFDGTDDREPLALTWAARHFTASRDRTHLIVWRDSGHDQPAFDCDLIEGGWFPLGLEELVVWDEAEDFVEFNVEGLFPFPAETQRIEVTGVPPGFASGWLSFSVSEAPRGQPGLQSIVFIQQDNRKRRSLYMAQPFDFGGFVQSMELSSACGPAPDITTDRIPFP